MDVIIGLTGILVTQDIYTIPNPNIHPGKRNLAAQYLHNIGTWGTSDLLHIKEYLGPLWGILLLGWYAGKTIGISREKKIEKRCSANHVCIQARFSGWQPCQKGRKTGEL